MSDRRARPLWPVLTAAALIGLPMLYALSFGPVVWVSQYAGRHGWIEAGDTVHTILLWIYFPLVWILDNGPQPIADALLWYAQLFSAL